MPVALRVGDVSTAPGAGSDRVVRKLIRRPSNLIIDNRSSAPSARLLRYGVMENRLLKPASVRGPEKRRSISPFNGNDIHHYRMRLVPRTSMMRMLTSGLRVIQGLAFSRKH